MLGIARVLTQPRGLRRPIAGGGGALAGAVQRARIPHEGVAGLHVGCYPLQLLRHELRR